MRRLLNSLGLILAASVGVHAQTPLVAIPERIPRPQRDSLLAERQRVDRAIDSVNAEIPVFNARCGNVSAGTPGRAACETDFARLSAASSAMESAKQALAASVATAQQAVASACPTIDARVARDREQLRRQQAVSETAAGEIEDWARESEDAQRAALSVAVTSIFGEAASRLTGRMEQARNLQRLVRQHEAQLRAAGENTGEILALLQRAERGYVTASAAAGLGRGYQAVGNVDAAIGLLRSEAAAIERFATLADTDVRTLLSRERLRALTLENTALSEYARALADHVPATPRFERFAAAYGVAALVVDYGYEAARWETARRAIESRHALTDQQLRAVAALRAQMERSIELQRVCRLP